MFAHIKKGEIRFKKISRRSELREFCGKTNCKSFREVSFMTSLASPIPFTPIKIPDLFQPAQHNTQDSTHVVPGLPAPTTYLDPHSRQEKLALLLTRRHKDGPPSRALRPGTGAGVRHGRGTLGCLGCSLPLLECHVLLERLHARTSRVWP